MQTHVGIMYPHIADVSSLFLNYVVFACAYIYEVISQPSMYLKSYSLLQRFLGRACLFGSDNSITPCPMISHLHVGRKINVLCMWVGSSVGLLEFLPVRSAGWMQQPVTCKQNITTTTADNCRGKEA